MTDRRSPDEGPLNIAFATCGDKARLEEVSVMLKSAVAFSKRPINFVVFTDSLGEEISSMVAGWNRTGLFQNLEVDLREPDFPLEDEVVNKSLHMHKKPSS